MCLIAFAWRTHPQYQLLLAANRDEFHARASAPLQRWTEAPRIIAGRDLVAGGTWLGITDNSRFAALTNVREPQRAAAALRSRGDLARSFLLADTPVGVFAAQVELDAYAGFNLLLGDGTDLLHLSNRGERVAQRLTPGVYGLSNAGLNSAWPKVNRAMAALAAHRSDDDDAALWQMLSDSTQAQDRDLPATGVPLEWERQLSACFIRGEQYGTRACTLLKLSNNAASIEERSFGPGGAALGQARLSLDGLFLSTP